MAFLKTADHKAIAWWAEERGLTPQLSTPPILYFKDSDGKEVKSDLFSITTLYKAWREEQKKANKKKVSA